MKRTQISLLLLLIAGIVSVILYTYTDSRNAVSAQETTAPEANMRALLERLHTRMETESEFTINVWFVAPLIPGELSWQIPGSMDGGASRRLGEIGDDYACFIQQGETFNESVCVPYSNIRMLTYANERSG